MPTDFNFSKQLKQAKRDAGLSQPKIAKQMSVSQERVWAIENHPENVSLKHIAKYLDICDKKLEVVDQ